MPLHFKRKHLSFGSQMQSFSNSFNVLGSCGKIWGGFLHFRVLHSFIKGVTSVLADFEIIPIEAVKRPDSWVWESAHFR
jgi:hypothetical protein